MRAEKGNLMSEKALKRHESFVPCRDYIFVLLLLAGMSTYLYGWRVLILCALSLATALVCDLLVCGLQRTEFDITDLSSYTFALIFTIMLPASVSFGVVLVGTAVTVLLGNHAFGGYGHYPFHPSAFGFAFVSVCYGAVIYQYPKPFTALGLSWSTSATLSTGVAQALRQGGVPSADETQLLLGQYAGPMGTTFCLIILSCMLLLIARGTMSWQLPVTYLATCALWAFAFPRIQTTRLLSVVYEMLSGAVIFAAVFIIAAPSLTPVSRRGKALCGFVLALVTMLYRTVGVFEMGVCFAALLVHPLSPWFDRILAPKKVYVRRKGGPKRV